MRDDAVEERSKRPFESEARPVGDTDLAVRSGRIDVRAVVIEEGIALLGRLAVDMFEITSLALSLNFEISRGVSDAERGGDWTGEASSGELIGLMSRSGAVGYQCSVGGASMTLVGASGHGDAKVNSSLQWRHGYFLYSLSSVACAISPTCW